METGGQGIGKAKTYKTIFGDFLFVTLSFGGHGGFLKTQNFQKM